MKKIIAIALTALMLAAIFCGCTANTTKGKLVLGTSADYPPFEFHMLDENGKDVIVGIDVSVAEKIAEDMGLELEIVDIGFDNLLTAMDKGQCDIVIAAMELDPERDKVADFSEPYYFDLPPMILVKAENVDQFTGLDSFDGLVVGAQTGTTKEDIVLNDLTGAELLSLATVNDLVNNLVYDKCSALVLDGAVALKYAATNPDLVICKAVSLGEAYPYRVAVKEGDPKGLLESINKTLAKITQDGTIDQYIEDADAKSANALEG
jgi:polar amino acid transport system substrate-binding protein